MIKALDPCTRGYLVSQFEVPQNIKQEVDWSRSWVAIDGSTMFSYRDEEVRQQLLVNGLMCHCMS